MAYVVHICNIIVVGPCIFFLIEKANTCHNSWSKTDTTPALLLVWIRAMWALIFQAFKSWVKTKIHIRSRGHKWGFIDCSTIVVCSANQPAASSYVQLHPVGASYISELSTSQHLGSSKGLAGDVWHIHWGYEATRIEAEHDQAWQITCQLRWPMDRPIHSLHQQASFRFID